VAGLPATGSRAEAVTLLSALYAVLVAAADEELSEAAERAMAWAAGLPAGSPLIPAADVLLAHPGDGHGDRHRRHAGSRRD